MDKFVQSCEQKFGTGLPMEACLGLLGELFQLEGTVAATENGSAAGGGGGLRQCPAEWERTQDQPAVTHNREHFAGPCTTLELWTLRFVFPLLQLACLGGNMFNLFVYNLPYFGTHNSAVNLLRAKAIANLLFVECRLLECLHAWLPLNAHFERFYWYSRPYMITLANLNGTVSTWMTMLISMQTLVCVFWPFSFQRLCARRPTLGALVCCVFCAALIHSAFLLTHQVVPDPSLQLVRLPPDSATLSASPPDSAALSAPFFCFRLLTSFRMRPSAWAALLERPYYWVQMGATIVLPTAVMLCCTALVVSRFTLKPQLGQAFSQRRKCVIRLTVATTGSHLMLEGPATISYVVFALRGAAMQDQWGWMCVLAAANNVLSALNATIPFFLFLACSAQFRHMSAALLLGRNGSGGTTVDGGAGNGMPRGVGGASCRKMSSSQCCPAPTPRGAPDQKVMRNGNGMIIRAENEEEDEEGYGMIGTMSGSETLL